MVARAWSSAERRCSSSRSPRSPSSRLARLKRAALATGIHRTAWRPVSSCPVGLRGSHPRRESSSVTGDDEASELRESTDGGCVGHCTLRVRSARAQALLQDVDEAAASRSLASSSPSPASPSTRHGHAQSTASYCVDAYAPSAAFISLTALVAHALARPRHQVDLAPRPRRQHHLSFAQVACRLSWTTVLCVHSLSIAPLAPSELTRAPSPASLRPLDTSSSRSRQAAQPGACRSLFWCVRSPSPDCEAMRRAARADLRPRSRAQLNLGCVVLLGLDFRLGPAWMGTSQWLRSGGAHRAPTGYGPSGGCMRDGCAGSPSVVPPAPAGLKGAS